MMDEFDPEVVEEFDVDKFDLKVEEEVLGIEAVNISFDSDKEGDYFVDLDYDPS